MGDSTQSGEHGRHDGHGDDTVRQHENEMSLLIGGEPRGRHPCNCCVDVGLGGKPCDDDVGRLVDEDEGNCPEGQHTGAAEACIAPIKSQPPDMTAAKEKRNEDECLDHDSQSGADTEDQDL